MLTGDSRPRIVIEWKDLSFDVRSEKNKTRSTKAILKSVSGFGAPGELLAIMGSSGAGKTTLLNLISGRTSVKRNQKLLGSIMLNGKEADFKSIRRFSAYVMQEDVFYESLTPRELITASAMLRLPNTVSAEERNNKIESVITELGLEKVADTVVGGPSFGKRGLSGGEKKRVAIAIELVNDPSILFLDEPTSGLDSLTAKQVMETLRDLARKSGRTVICTIHQPSSEIYETFDKLYLMVDGRIIYHGPKNEAVEHFSEIGFTCPKFANPADYFMMRVMQFSGSQEDVERVDRLVEARKRKEISPPEHGAPPDASKMRAARVSAFVQLNVLLRRSFLNYIRLPLNARAKLFQSVFIACFVGILYVPLGNDQTAIRDRSSALFIAVLNVTMNAVSGVVLTFSSEKSIVLRETANKMYGPTVYFFSKLLAEFPFELLFPSLYAILSFFIVGFNRTARTFFFYLLTVLIANHVGRGMGSIVAAAAPNGDAAVSLFPIVIIPFVLFSGLFIAPENIPVYFRWIADISPFRYGYEAFLTNEFKGITFRCKEDQFLIVNNQKVCPMTKGEQFLALRGLEPSDFASRIGAMLAIWVATTAAAFLVLRFKSKNRA